MLLTAQMQSFARRVCVCVWERESHITALCVCVCVRVRVCERERERDTVQRRVCVSVCVCVCVCSRVWERETRSNHNRACLQTHTSIITMSMSVTRLCSPLGLELMGKLRALLTVFTFILKAKAHDYGKGRYISDSRLWCSANHNALCQLANQSRLRLPEGGTL